MALPEKKPASQIAREVAKIEKDKLTAINAYAEASFEYGPTNPNAISDGDTKGRGQNGESIGTSIDKAEKDKLIAQNQFNDSAPYTNPDFN